MAIENLFTFDLKPWRIALVFGFGLLHGMGFAGVLEGLACRGRNTALITFNLSVEAGQFTVLPRPFCWWFTCRRAMSTLAVWWSCRRRA